MFLPDVLGLLYTILQSCVHRRVKLNGSYTLVLLNKDTDRTISHSPHKIHAFHINNCTIISIFNLSVWNLDHLSYKEGYHLHIGIKW